MRRVNYIDEESEEKESDSNEEQLVLQTDGNGSKPFCMEGTMCGNYFKTIIDTGSPVSIFTKRDLTKINGEKSRFQGHDRQRAICRLQQKTSGSIGLPNRALRSCRCYCLEGKSASRTKQQKVDNRP